MNKKMHLIKILLACCLIFSTLSISAYAFNEEAIYDCAGEGANLVEMIMKSNDLFTEYEISKYLDADVQKYVEGMIEVSRHVSALCNGFKENYRINVTLNKQQALENLIYLQYKIKVDFNYCDLPDISSGYGKVVDILWDTGRDKVVDLYCPYIYYDEFIRGIDYDVRNFTLNSKSDSKHDIDHKIAELLKDINAQHEIQ